MLVFGEYFFVLLFVLVSAVISDISSEGPLMGLSLSLVKL